MTEFNEVLRGPRTLGAQFGAPAIFLILTLEIVRGAAPGEVPPHCRGNIGGSRRPFGWSPSPGRLGRRRCRRQHWIPDWKAGRPSPSDPLRREDRVERRSDTKDGGGVCALRSGDRRLISFCQCVPPIERNSRRRLGDGLAHVSAFQCGGWRALGSGVDCGWRISRQAWRRRRDILGQVRVPRIGLRVRRVSCCGAYLFRHRIVARLRRAK